MSIARAAKLILTLVDNVSKPAGAITAALTGVNAAVATAGRMTMSPAAALTNTARNFRRAAGDFTVAGGAVAMGLGLAGKAIYDMEDTLNEIEGRRFGKRDVFNLANGTEMTREAFRKSVTDLIAEINRTSPRHAGEIAKAYNQLVQAGLTHEQVEGVLPISIDFAIAGNYDTEEAADKLTNVITAMRLPMATMKEANESALRAADVISYAANETNSSVEQMTEAFKYAAPSASALGVSVEQLAAMFLIQAKRGIKASEAGVSIRAMMTRMVRPTKMAREALGRYNIDLADYLEKSQEITAGDITNAMQFGGLDAKGAEAEVQKILDSSAKTGAKVQQITAAIMKAVGDQTTMSADQISTSVNEILFGFGESLDIERLISDMQAAGIAMSDFFQIFDVRQGARTLALFGDDFSAWVRKLEENAASFAQVLRETRMQGVVGAVARLTAGMVDLFRAAAESGVLDTATRAIESFAAAMNRLKDVNPRILEIGTYGLMATAAIAPLGFAMSGVAAAAGLMVNPLTWAAAALGYLAYMNWDSLVAFGQGFKLGFLDNLDPNVLPKVAGWLTDINTALSGDGWAETGNWFGAGVAREINAFVASIEKLKAEVQALRDWWNGEGESPLQIKPADNAMGDFWRNLGKMNTGEFLKHYLVPDAWKPEVAVDEYLAQTRAAGEQVSRDLSVVATPIVNSSSIDAAIAKSATLRRMLEGMDSLGGRSAKPSGNSGSGNGGFGGPRAEGGPIRRGLTYLVGEEGPELFSAGADGFVTPNHAIGAAGSKPAATNVVMNISNRFVLNGGATEKQAADIFRELERQLTRSAQIIFGSGNTYGEA